MKYSLEAAPYTEQGFLGSGSFANVFQVRLNSTLYALKRFNPHQLQDSHYYQSAIREISIMQKLDHPNILKLLDVYRSDNTLELLLEYVPNGTLYQKLKEYERLPEYLAKHYLKGVLQAIKYLHSFPQPILHRDIKPENILIDMHNNVKICDFGSANLVLPDHNRTSYVGTDVYMAPEMRQSRPHNQSLDLWCFGILAYELLTGQPPSQLQTGEPSLLQTGQHPSQLQTGSQLHQFPDYISKPAQDLIRRILMENPCNRLNMDQIQNHIWFYDQCQDIEFSRFSLKDKQESEQEFMTRIECKNAQITRKLAARKNKVKEGTFSHNESQLSMASMASNTTKHSKQRQLIVEHYLEQLDRIAELTQIQKHNDKLLAAMQAETAELHKFEQAQTGMRRQSMRECERRIEDLSDRPYTAAYQVMEALQQISGALEELRKSVENIPNKYRKEILSFSEIMVEDIKMPDSEYLPKLKLQMLQARRDGLIELKCLIKRQQQMPHLLMVEDDLISNTADLSLDEVSSHNLLSPHHM